MVAGARGIVGAERLALNNQRHGRQAHHEPAHAGKPETNAYMTALAVVLMRQSGVPVKACVPDR